ncbi:hypothetical protein N7532_009223 [Penicillium argentinense]|uniref:Uncharacterized protein n=1 Tax=Penicillium argentinense TaxID=1131581 RepID=A0A9W9K2B5_9EURO|nr:uncharacterized protein N7532_009223 [Penicillium argentinense]KAJ5090539.1 hypothetical protein N7532_009223 [Penicillium argentinense]
MRGAPTGKNTGHEVREKYLYGATQADAQTILMQAFSNLESCPVQVAERVGNATTLYQTEDEQMVIVMVHMHVTERASRYPVGFENTGHPRRTTSI